MNDLTDVRHLARWTSPVLAAALLLIAGGCPAAEPVPPAASRTAPPTEAATAPAEVADEVAQNAAPADDDGWITIFNGVDLSGWTPKFAGSPLGENLLDTFRVEDGALVVDYSGYDAFEGRFGHLFYEHEHAHYLLRLEYRFTGEQAPGGPGWAFRNSGVMIHGQPADSMRLDQSFPVSIEVQILGGDGTNDRPTGNLCTPGTHVEMDGELVTRHCTNSVSPTFHGDDWVTLEIEVRGHEIVRHVINDEIVLEYEAPQLDPNDADAKAWIERRGGDVALAGGTISLQAESHPCAFRGIRLKVLDE